MEVFNHSRLMMEPATEMECPRCKGHGATHKDALNGTDCDLCGGDGRVVGNKDSGWYRREIDPADISLCY